MQETVNHPAHYTAGSLEVIDAIEGLELGFHAGNVVKYVARYKHKHKHKNGIEDLRKAAWYLNRLIELETKNVSGPRCAGLDSSEWSAADNDAVDLPTVHPRGGIDAQGQSA